MNADAPLLRSSYCGDQNSDLPNYQCTKPVGHAGDHGYAGVFWPGTERPTVYDYATMPVRITRDAVYFGDERIPGAIAEGGITLKPGGASDCNLLTVTFIVGPVTADDPVTTTEEIPSAPVTRYRSRPRPEGGES
jgi:hypothetical protein